MLPIAVYFRIHFLLYPFYHKISSSPPPFIHAYYIGIVDFFPLAKSIQIGCIFQLPFFQPPICFIFSGILPGFFRLSCVPLWTVPGHSDTIANERKKTRGGLFRYVTNSHAARVPAALRQPSVLPDGRCLHRGLFGRMSYAAVMADLIAQEGLGKSQAGLIGTMFFRRLRRLSAAFRLPRRPHFAQKAHLHRYHRLGGAQPRHGSVRRGPTRSCSPCGRSTACSNPCSGRRCPRLLRDDSAHHHRKRACANGAATYPIATILTYLFASALLHFTGWARRFPAVQPHHAHFGCVLLGTHVVL